MKKLTTIMAAGLAVLAYHTADAQVGLRLNFNLGGVAVHAAFNPPVAVQYANNDYGNDDYYYLPDVEAYYSVPQQRYYYNDGRQWVSASYLPGRFRDFDWRNARHYEIRGQRPFMNHDTYRSRYGGADQRGGGYADNRSDNRGGFDRQRDNDERGFGRPNGGNFDNHDRRYPDGQFQGGNNNGRNGFDQPQNNRGGQFQQPANQGGQNQNGNAGQNQNGSAGQNQNGNQNRGGGMNQQPANNAGQNNGGGQNQNGNGGRNRGGSTDQQPANNAGQNQNGQPAGQGRASGNDNHFAANQMGVIRPARF